jgi:hypothetical protein
MAKAGKRKPFPETDLGPAERSRQQGGLDLEPVARDLRGNATQMRAKAKVECILDAYWRRCQIIDRQHEAGLVFRTYWHRAQGAPRVTTRYDLSPRFRAIDSEAPNVARTDAQRRLENALGRCPRRSGRWWSRCAAWTNGPAAPTGWTRCAAA